MNQMEGTEDRVGQSERMSAGPAVETMEAEVDLAVGAGAGGAVKRDAGPRPGVIDPQPTPSRHPLLGAFGVLVVSAAVIVGGPWGVRDRLIDLATSDEVAAPALEWQSVVTLRGTGTMDAAPFSIAPTTKAWRVRWTCQTGNLVVSGLERPGPMIDGVCPGGGIQFASGSGPTKLSVATDGPWQLDVERQAG